jgi:hypothetical protein
VSGAHQNTLKGHPRGVNLVAFSPDGTCIVSGSSDDTLRVWDAASGMHLNTLEGHYSAVPSVALSTSSTPMSDPASAGPLFGYVMNDGWIYSLTRERRLCWLPIACRPYLLAVTAHRAVLCPRDGKVIILDFTGMDSYFRDL